MLVKSGGPSFAPTGGARTSHQGRTRFKPSSNPLHVTATPIPHHRRPHLRSSCAALRQASLCAGPLSHPTASSYMLRSHRSPTLEPTQEHHTGAPHRSPHWSPHWSPHRSPHRSTTQEPQQNEILGCTQRSFWVLHAAQPLGVARSTAFGCCKQRSFWVLQAAQCLGVASSAVFGCCTQHSLWVLHAAQVGLRAQHRLACVHSTGWPACTAQVGLRAQHTALALISRIKRRPAHKESTPGMVYIVGSSPLQTA
eukprot:351595-Chlamydomonas_euryale.AAC.3